VTSVNFQQSSSHHQQYRISVVRSLEIKKIESEVEIRLGKDKICFSLQKKEHNRHMEEPKFIQPSPVKYFIGYNEPSNNPFFNMLCS